MNFCPNCGSSLKQDAKFCSNCGTALTHFQSATVVAPQQAEEVVTPEEVDADDDECEIDVELLCPHCHHQYSVLKEDWDKEDIYWSCPSCGERIDAAFCGYCNQHHGYIAFRPYSTKEILGASIIGGIIGYNNPEDTIGNILGSLFDSTPKAKASGVCPKCQAEFVKCPVCHTAVHITFEDGGAVVCPDCHTKFKMN